MIWLEQNCPLKKLFLFYILLFRIIFSFQLPLLEVTVTKVHFQPLNHEVDFFRHLYKGTKFPNQYHEVKFFLTPIPRKKFLKSIWSGCDLNSRTYRSGWRFSQPTPYLVKYGWYLTKGPFSRLLLLNTTSDMVEA